MHDGQRERGGGSRAAAKCHRVKSRHECRLLGKIAFDHAGQQDVAGGNRRTRHC